MRWTWIDRFVSFESGKSAVAVKNLSLAEDHFADHFPGFPVMPAPLILEGLAQTGGILVGEANNYEKNVVLAKMNNVKIRREALAGEQLTYTATVVALNDTGAQVQATARSGNELILEAEIMFAHVSAAQLPPGLPSTQFVFDGGLKNLLRTAESSKPRAPEPVVAAPVATERPVVVSIPEPPAASIPESPAVTPVVAAIPAVSEPPVESAPEPVAVAPVAVAAIESPSVAPVPETPVEPPTPAVPVPEPQIEQPTSPPVAEQSATEVPAEPPATEAPVSKPVPASTTIPELYPPAFLTESEAAEQDFYQPGSMTPETATESPSGDETNKQPRGDVGATPADGPNSP